MNARKLRLTGLVSLCALIGALLCFSAPALAVKTRLELGSFGGESSPAPLSNPQGLAVDQPSGAVYVADSGNARIEKFDAMGNFELAFGANVGGLGVNTCTTLCGAGTVGSAPGELTEAKFVAVDDSTGPSAGDVYVADTSSNVISKFSPAGELITTWGTGGQLNGSTTDAGSWGAIAGITVDADGALDVLSGTSELFEFAQTGAFAREIGVGRATEVRGVAVDSAGHVFKVNGDQSVEETDAAGSDIGQVTFNSNHSGAQRLARALTVEAASGDLYVASGPTFTIEHYSFNGQGEVLESDGSSCANFEHANTEAAGCAPSDLTSVGFEAAGIAVASSSGDTYLSNPAEGAVYRYGPLVAVPNVSTGTASQKRQTSVVLNGTVNPEGLPLTGCSFEYGTEAGIYGQSAPCAQSSAQIGAGEEPVAVSAAVTGLSEGATYHYRLSASNANGPFSGQDGSFTTATPPFVGGAAAVNITSNSADLTTSIDPDNGETSYRFEYGTSTAYGASAPAADVSVGEGSSTVQVRQSITGLSANTTYHFRVVAHNSAGTAVSPDHVFVYETSGGGLPDNRSYELVTPTQKNGALIGATLLSAKAQVSEDGSRVMATSLQCFGEEASCTANRQTQGEPAEFARTSSGWTTVALAPPANRFSTSTTWGDSVEGSTALFSMPIQPSGADFFYGRLASGEFVDIGPKSPPALGAAGPLGGPVTTATADLSHVVYDALAPYLWPFDTSYTGSLYEYVGTGNTEPLLVGVKGGRGSTDLISQCETLLGASANGETYGALSTDGRTVFFTARSEGSEGCPSGKTGPAVNELYARIDESRTVPISESPSADCTTTACVNAPHRAGEFEGASTDGSKVFFTSTQQLTDTASEDGEAGDTAFGDECRSTVGAGGCNLYEYDFDNPAGHNLVDVSAGAPSSGGPRVRGVEAISTDGSHTYFVAGGVLTAVANAHHETAQDGANNLYAFERDATYPNGHLAFVATLPDSDSAQWESGVGPSDVTPDGRFLVFVSHGDLTPDDHSQADAPQVFSYDAQSATLTRISIGENGFNDNGNAGIGAASIAPGEMSTVDGAARSDPTMSHDGSFIFFQSPVALTPHALNDVPVGATEGLAHYAQNVYEYHEGQVYLISDGRDVSSEGTPCELGAREEAHSISSVCLLGTDATGTNVFFTTSDRMVAQDVDTQLDIYDARSCSASSPCIAQTPPPLPPCLGEVCHGVPSPTPPVSSVPTSTFDGQGNIVPVPAAVKKAKQPKAVKKCAKGKTRVHGKCTKAKVKKKRKAVKAKRKAVTGKSHREGK
jgi:NHL repeat